MPLEPELLLALESSEQWGDVCHFVEISSVESCEFKQFFFWKGNINLPPCCRLQTIAPNYNLTVWNKGRMGSGHPSLVPWWSFSFGQRAFSMVLRRLSFEQVSRKVLGILYKWDTSSNGNRS